MSRLGQFLRLGRRGQWFAKRQFEVTLLRERWFCQCQSSNCKSQTPCSSQSVGVSSVLVDNNNTNDDEYDIEMENGIEYDDDYECDNEYIYEYDDEQSDGGEEKQKQGGKGGKGGKKGKHKHKGKGNVQLDDHLDLDFINHRINKFEEVYQRQLEERKEMSKKITIKLPDGKEFAGVAGQDTPYDIAKSISLTLSKNAIVARVNGVLWDLLRPFEEDCSLEILTFDNEDGKHVFWHSSSHVLGQSLERLFCGKLTVGPALDPSQMLHNGGFYYDVDTTDLGESQTISQSHYDSIEKFVKKSIIDKKQPFQRVVLTKDEALDMFKFNKYKQELISEKIEDGTTCTAYRCGPLIDLCRGPHIPNTGLIKAMQIVKNGATYWKNDNKRESLQRIYGISFPNKKDMKEYLELKKRAEESDHRHIGEKQNLFFFNDLSPGSCFWLPHGARVYTKLQKFMRECYYKRGFTEVVSPNVFKFTLWETSGHAANYKDNMFLFDVEGQDFGLKPMNCPGHCLMYKHELRSYRDLPIRFADFGVLHRNELSGSLTGLTRVRRFCQDDAHIFCRHDQIESEIMSALDFLQYIYSVFDFEFELELSTRPEDKYLGDIKVWDEAELQLKKCLDSFCNNTKKSWKLNPGDGAFYGPKIDIKVYDSLRREHQCATIQLDFQLPIRFDLHYQSHEKTNERPVIIHRAIYGSFERFIAILIEHLGGKWPFWLSPRQVCIVPVTKHHFEYAKKVCSKISQLGYYCDADLSNNRQAKKIAMAEVKQYNFILVVGNKEIENETVNIRTRNNEQHGEKTVDETLKWFDELVKTFSTKY